MYEPHTLRSQQHPALQEGDPEGWWQESFKSHTDSKPKGPEGIAIDLTFPQAQHVYGLPEHATSFALKPTTGPFLWHFMVAAWPNIPACAINHFYILCQIVSHVCMPA